MTAHVFGILKDNVQTMSDKVPMSSLIFDEMSIRKLTVLDTLRIFEATAGQTILQIMPLSSCSMVYIKSRRNQFLLM
jgi:hypothetical protein